MKSSIIDTPKEINIVDQKINPKELRNAINKASAHIDSSIKLYKEKAAEYIVIFSWQDHNRWKVDYPVQLHKIHKQRYVSHKQCLELSQHIYNGNSLDDLNGFVDVPIRHFTLDEMLDFKKEDEMMMRGEDPDLLIPTPVPSKKPKILEIPKNNQEQSFPKRSSRILGDIAVPKEQPRAKSVSNGTTKKTRKTSPLKQIKESTEHLKKEKKQTDITTPSVKSTVEKVNPPKSTPGKTENTDIIHSEKTRKPKKESKSSLILGEQLDTDKTTTTTPTPPKPKTAAKSSKKTKPSSDDSLFQI